MLLLALVPIGEEPIERLRHDPVAIGVDPDDMAAVWLEEGEGATVARVVDQDAVADLDQHLDRPAERLLTARTHAYAPMDALEHSQHVMTAVAATYSVRLAVFLRLQVVQPVQEVGQARRLRVLQGVDELGRGEVQLLRSEPEAERIEREQGRVGQAAAQRYHLRHRHQRHQLADRRGRAGRRRARQTRAVLHC